MNCGVRQSSPSFTRSSRMWRAATLLSISNSPPPMLVGGSSRLSPPPPVAAGRGSRGCLLAVEHVDEIWVDVEVDEGELRLPLADQLATLIRIDGPPGLVAPVLKRQRDEIADGLAHDDQDPGSRTSFTLLALPFGCRHSSG